MRRRWLTGLVLVLATVLAGCAQPGFAPLDLTPDQDEVDEIWAYIDGVGPTPEVGQDLAAVPLQPMDKPEYFQDNEPRFQAELDKERRRMGTDVDRDLADEVGRYLCSALSGGGLQVVKAQAVFGYFEVEAADALPLMFAALRGYCPESKNRYISLTYARPVQDKPSRAQQIEAVRFFYVELFEGNARGFDSIRPRDLVRSAKQVCGFDYEEATPSWEQLFRWMPQFPEEHWPVQQLGLVSVFCPEQSEALLADLGILNDL